MEIPLGYHKRILGFLILSKSGKVCALNFEEDKTTLQPCLASFSLGTMDFQASLALAVKETDGKGTPKRQQDSFQHSHEGGISGLQEICPALSYKVSSPQFPFCVHFLRNPGVWYMVCPSRVMQPDFQNVNCTLGIPDFRIALVCLESVFPLMRGNLNFGEQSDGWLCLLPGLLWGWQNGRSISLGTVACSGFGLGT